ncbi:MAG: hypothetical protein ACXWNG_03475 [Candidatus Limnocylindrales bacterium]
MADRTPGLREVLLLAGVVVAAVLLIMVVTSLVGPLRDALSALPIAVIVLIAGTVGLLLLLARDRARPST